MPVIIEEIVVTASVTEQERSEAPANQENRDELKKEIIRECVDKVMEIIRNQKER